MRECEDLRSTILGLDHGIWDLVLGIWDLGFGTWDLELGTSPPQTPTPKTFHPQSLQIQL
jgi:hypothetical protein